MVPDCHIKNLSDFKGAKKSFKWAKKELWRLNVVVMGAIVLP